MSPKHTCPECNGTGETDDGECDVCGGTGEDREITLDEIHDEGE